MNPVQEKSLPFTLTVEFVTDVSPEEDRQRHQLFVNSVVDILKQRQKKAAQNRNSNE